MGAPEKAIHLKHRNPKPTGDSMRLQATAQKHTIRQLIDVHTALSWCHTPCTILIDEKKGTKSWVPKLNPNSEPQLFHRNCAPNLTRTLWDLTWVICKNRFKIPANATVDSNETGDATNLEKPPGPPTAQPKSKTRNRREHCQEVFVPQTDLKRS